ncbi:hypothetical protein IJM16_00595 [Candidatus Saccharibacteria bacterium]|nr:hypothetical protein [Candidatus Saccharibacteria bacterium]
MKIAKIFVIATALASLFFPTFAYAESCSTNAICPTSIEFLEKSQNTEILTEASIDDAKISADVKMLELGDYIKYKLILENVSGDTYTLSEVSFDDAKAIDYSLMFANDETEIKPGEKKEATLTIEYKKHVEDSEYVDNTYVSNLNALLVLAKNESTPNPSTSADLPMIFVIVFAAIILACYVYYRKYGHIRPAVIAILFVSAFVSFGVYAAESCTIEIESKITIPKYEGREINNIIMEKPIIDDEHSTYMEPVTGVNFLEPSSNANGKGVYIFAPTKNDDIPIYYYRGAVDNNNLIFADFCWKIFRTTKTEGLKIIYNGVPTNGQCIAEGDDTMIASGVKYNAAVNNLSYFGYSYASNGHTFKYMSNSKITNGMIFANDVSYVDGHYVLNDDQYVKDDNFAADRDSILKTHHYTCFKANGTECETVRYVYMTRSVNMFYVTLKDGEKIEDVVRNEVTNEANTNKSIVRGVVDDWYRDNMTAYTDELEDTVWCNDRSLYGVGGWGKDNDVLEITNEQDGKMIFNANYRVFTTGKPDINCANKNDAFTVSEENGNGDLEYPVGLMTLDEAVMAGFNWYRYDNSSDNYLNNGKGWWLMSPSLVSANNVYVGVAYSRVDHVTPVFTSNGLGGVRPMVSLKKGYKVSSGDGTSSNPFVLGKDGY